MPFTTQELSDAGKTALDYFERNKPVDQVSTQHPLLKMLKSKQKYFPGGKQFIVEQLHVRNQSNAQWYYGAQTVTYNKRQPVEQSQFPYRGMHDGFYLDEDRLLQNGISIEDSKPMTHSKAEVVQLSNLMEEQIMALDIGFEEKLDQAVHLDGSQGVENLAGLDVLISLTPTVGTVGGINRATEVWWRNNVATGLTSATTTGNILDVMETQWRGCIRNGGVPNYILAGSTFIDALRNFILKSFGQINYSTGGVKAVEVGTGSGTGLETGLFFHGVPIMWDPTFQDLDTLFAPAIPWEKRCYFLNSNYLRLRPMEGEDMKSRTPPRVYNQYVHYWATTWKGGMTMSRANAHSVLALA